MNPKLWGRGMWVFIFAIICKHQREPQMLEQVKKMVYTIGTNLPCKTCRDHYAKHVEESDIMNCLSFDEYLRFHVNLYNQHHLEKPIN